MIEPWTPPTHHVTKISTCTVYRELNKRMTSRWRIWLAETFAWHVHVNSRSLITEEIFIKAKSFVVASSQAVIFDYLIKILHHSRSIWNLSEILFCWDFIILSLCVCRSLLFKLYCVQFSQELWLLQNIVVSICTKLKLNFSLMLLQCSFFPRSSFQQITRNIYVHN